MAVAAVFACILVFASPVRLSAFVTELRIGLAQLYSQCEEITVNNKSLSVGYCVNGVYTEEAVISSPDGFKFTPATGFFCVCNSEFTAYADAKREADRIRSNGTDAYPCAIHKGTWLIYVGGGTREGAEAARNIAVTASGLGFDTLTGDNGNRVLVKGTDTVLMFDAGVTGIYPQLVPLQEGSGIPNIDLGSRKYRGRMEIGRFGRPGVSAVNIVELEQYLYGVVSCEMPGFWPAEALKAQAVCARSYALSRLEEAGAYSLLSPYQMDDTTNYQVYGGYGLENDASVFAVQSTRGLTVKKNGKTIAAFFFSTSGGATENVMDVWGFDASYLHSVPDIYETKPEALPWVMTMTKTRIKALLNGSGIYIGDVKEVYPTSISATGRINRLTVTGTQGNIVLGTDRIRNILGLPSTKFTVVAPGDIPDTVSVKSNEGQTTLRISESYVLTGSGSIGQMPDAQQYIVLSADNLKNFCKDAPAAGSYTFAGMGWGHGVGLSQSGAKGMANAGYNYRQIIEYYYTGCKVQ